MGNALETITYYQGAWNAVPPISGSRLCYFKLLLYKISIYFYLIGAKYAVI
jgi:hypothetical protein